MRDSTARAGKLAAMILGVAMLASPAHAQLYKWVDEKGRTHYGEKPPDGTVARPMGTTSTRQAPPAGRDSAVTAPDWKAKALEANRRIEARELQAKRDALDSAEREQLCKEAQLDLAILTDNIPVYELDAKGQPVFLEDRDRPAAIAGQKKRVASLCK